MAIYLVPRASVETFVLVLDGNTRSERPLVVENYVVDQVFQHLDPTFTS